jgi:hypothetical protein
MAAGDDERNKIAVAIYGQLGKALKELGSSDDLQYRLQELEKVARIYAQLAEVPSAQQPTESPAEELTNSEKYQLATRDMAKKRKPQIVE